MSGDSDVIDNLSRLMLIQMLHMIVMAAPWVNIKKSKLRGTVMFSRVVGIVFTYAIIVGHH